MSKGKRAKLLFDPYPRSMDLIFTERDRQRFESLFDIVSWEGERMPDSMVEEHIGDSFAIVGQTNLPTSRLLKAKRLKAIVNVEGNFLQNIDYDYCFSHGIYVLNAGVAFSRAVAEISLGFAISLAREIVPNDRLFREGRERYGRASNAGSFLLAGKNVGIIGLGNVGRALLKLLSPFAASISVYDPWLPDNYLRELGCRPVSLSRLLSDSKVIFILAGATSENRAMLGEKGFSLIESGSILILASRASLVDFDAMTRRLKKGDIRAAIDVFPEEPYGKESTLRKLDNVILSAHRAGGIDEAYKLMGEMVTDDLELILRGLPPVRLQRASRETVVKMASRPVG